MTEPAARLSPRLIRRWPTRPAAEPPLVLTVRARLSADLRLFLIAYLAGFIAFMLFLA